MGVFTSDSIIELLHFLLHCADYRHVSFKITSCRIVKLILTTATNLRLLFRKHGNHVTAHIAAPLNFISEGNVPPNKIDLLGGISGDHHSKPGISNSMSHWPLLSAIVYGTTPADGARDWLTFPLPRPVWAQPVCRVVTNWACVVMKTSLYESVNAERPFVLFRASRQCRPF